MEPMSVSDGGALAQRIEQLHIIEQVIQQVGEPPRQECAEKSGNRVSGKSGIHEELMIWLFVAPSAMRIPISCLLR